MFILFLFVYNPFVLNLEHFRLLITKYLSIDIEKILPFGSLDGKINVD